METGSLTGRSGLLQEGKAAQRNVRPRGRLGLLQVGWVSHRKPLTGRPGISQGGWALTGRPGLLQGSQAVHRNVRLLTRRPGLLQGCRETYRKKIPLIGRQGP